jgi:transposase
MNNTNNKKPTTQTSTKAKTICKLGLYVHAASIMAARQVEGMNPQPPQKFAVEKFLGWVAGLLQKGYEVISCYEAGPTGYWLHRRLQALGVTNYVICPTRLDSRGKGVNTDKTDATELLVRLDRYVAGNRKAFSVVRVPTEEQEQKRAQSRQRDQLRRKRLSFAAQGRMLLLSQGYRQSNSWWQPLRWFTLRTQLPGWLEERLETLRRVIEFIDGEVKTLSQAVVRQAPRTLPVGMGQLTHEVLEREMKDWNNFQNRRLSCCLIECAWRMVLAQPNYWLVKKWSAVLLNRKIHLRRRKQAIVAFARQLLIDIWKWKTGKTTPAALGWQMT